MKPAPPSSANHQHRETAWHALAPEELLARLHSTPHGLSAAEAAVRLERHGPNRLPRREPPGPLRVFLSQFASPLIYVLLAASVVSAAIGEWADAGFIFAVLLLNAVIGTVQEYSAQRAADQLQGLIRTRSRVLRDGEVFEIEAEAIVPGDVVLLESGDRVPADLRLLAARDLEIDESLLTGESLAVHKEADRVLAPDAVLAERSNMAFAGTMVARGRGRGVVVATGLDTALGQIARDVLQGPGARAPLLVRMESFTRRIALLVGLATLVLAAVSLVRGLPLTEVFLMAVALAVSVIPEGLPVAMTVALAVGMARMARRNVIVRRLMAMEALGSCTYIATDKTGTLTVNRLTVQRIVFPGVQPWGVTGEGLAEGVIEGPEGAPTPEQAALLERLVRAAVLANEAHIAHRDGQWVAHGDAVDVALLVLARKVGRSREEMLESCPELDALPFESERMYAASLNRVQGRPMVFVKGAVEKVLPMCRYMARSGGDQPLDRVVVEAGAAALAEAGFRVLALAEGPAPAAAAEGLAPEHLRDLTLLGLVGMIDPLRPEARAAIAACRTAGIEVAMVTGDHPATAYTIARELELVRDRTAVVTGTELREARDQRRLDALIARARVFARVEPHQKLDIVRGLQRQGHFVAVSGDGANDAPALRAAEVGVAMGRSGTDLARETADLIITDDNFASLVAGVEEGRIAYANVRKVIFLLISTGAAELVLFVLSLLSGLPLPLVAVQLLWLNLVTNGIQDVALAFEPGEGDELLRPPRPPQEPIFNRLMVERVLVSALWIGALAFAVFWWLLEQGYGLEQARNGTLLLMVLFENVHVFNSRSETRSAFRHDPRRNPLLLFGTALAQLVHIGAMYTPGLAEVLAIQPVSPAHWSELLVLALSLLLVMELHKLWWARRGRGSGPAP